MIKFWNPFRAKPGVPQPALPAGQRIYAIGDIHGCLAQFAALVDAIETDDALRGEADTLIILLGDLIDRGLDSAGVISFARSLASRRNLRILMGNHEEMFLEALRDDEILRHFLRFGGRETALSYPIDARTYTAADLNDVRAMMLGAIPAEDIAFIQSFEDYIAIGDYLFVHAGIRPGIPIEEQHTSDLRWIRGPFLTSSENFGAVVVHGHTIANEVQIRPNRIGIDTGAYKTGRLTALALQGTARWLIEAAQGIEQGDGVMTVTQRSLS